MGLSATIAQALVSAKAALGDLLVDVSHYAATGALNSDAEPTVGAAVTRQAVVERKVRVIRRGDLEVVAGAKLTFVEPVAVTWADTFTIPGGTTAPVVDIGGVVSADAGSGKTFVTEVWLGTVGQG